MAGLWEAALLRWNIEGNGAADRVLGGLVLL
jgi:hypothetical protein